MGKLNKRIFHRVKHLIPIISILFFIFTSVIFSKSNLSQDNIYLNKKLKKHIYNTFYHAGKPCKKKIDLFRVEIINRLDQISSNFNNYYFLQKKLSKKNTEKKTRKNKNVRIYKILLKYLELLEKEEDPLICLKIAIKILRLNYALKASARKLPSVELIEKIPFSFKAKKIPKIKTDREEASNLVDPLTKKVYNQEQLKNLRLKGVDLSRLNPHPDSPLWRSQDISSINVLNFYSNAQDSLHKGLKIIFPKKKAWFDGVRKTQSKPKFDLFFYHRGKKIRLKIKLAREVHAETTCAALMTTLGYSADCTKYVRDFKILLGDVTIQEFRREWKSYYGKYNPDLYIKKYGKDKDGNFIIAHEAVLEAKHPDLIRVGPWAYGSLWNRSLREVRGCLLFNMWVGNLDMKEAENNKVVLKKTEKGYRLFQIQHDMGFAFGKTHMERPGEFKWNLVKKVTKKSIHMNFNCLVNNTLFKSVTYNDSRWMARLIAQLSRRQITSAVVLGGWPDPLGKLLVEKLIARRNQLVEIFNLIGEKSADGNSIVLLDCNRSISTEDGVVKKGKLEVYRFDGYPQYFGPRINEFFSILLKGLRNLVVDTSVNLASSIKYIELEPEIFGLNSNFISKVILRMDREIETNPNPLSREESYLVKDHLQLGFRLGYGSVISGDLAYWRKYTLVYPVETRDAGRFHGKFILNLLLPFRFRGDHIKGNHVVLIDDYIEGRGKIKLNALSRMLECSLTASKIFLRRHIIGFKNDPFYKHLYFIDDKNVYDELRLRIFFDIFNLFRSTPLDIYSQSGNLNRKMVYLDLSDVDNNKKKQFVLDQLLLKGNEKPILDFGIQYVLNDKFLEQKNHLKLLGMIRLKSIFRKDKIKVDLVSENKKKPSKSFLFRDTSLKEGLYFQIKNIKLKSWRFFDNAERHYHRICLSAKMDKKSVIYEPILTVFLQVNDWSTHNGELKNGYLNLINTIALDKNFISFDPDKHSNNMMWGNTITQIKFILYREGIETLSRVSGAEVWKALAQITGKTVKYWRILSLNPFRKNKHTLKYSKNKYLAVKTRYFIRELYKASQKKNSDQMKHIVKAVRKAIYISGQTFSPVLLAVIHKLVGSKNLFLTTKIFTPENKELIFPSRIPLYNEIGKDRGIYPPVFQFIFDDPSEIYNFVLDND